MAVADGIGGTSVGAVFSETAGTKTITDFVQNGVEIVLAIPEQGGVFRRGNFLRLLNCFIDGIPTGDEKFEVSNDGSDIAVVFKIPPGTTFTTGVGPAVAPVETAFGLLNTRQTMIQGLQGGFVSSLLPLGEPDDEWAQTNGPGAGLVPNALAPLPGGMNAPTTEYSVRRYMVNFALGTFTQVVDLLKLRTN